MSEYYIESTGQSGGRCCLCRKLTLIRNSSDKHQYCESCVNALVASRRYKFGEAEIGFHVGHACLLIAGRPVHLDSSWFAKMFGGSTTDNGDGTFTHTTKFEKDEKL